VKKLIFIITVLVVFALCGTTQALVSASSSLSKRKAEATVKAVIKERFPSYRKRGAGGVSCPETDRLSSTNVGCSASWDYKGYAFVGYLRLTLRGDGIHYRGSVDRGPSECFPEGCGNDRHYKLKGVR
jgi:hypothetical protein